jgi:hypothetical protein
MAFHVGQIGLLVVLQGPHRNAGPGGHHVLDVLFVDLGELLVVLLGQFSGGVLQLLPQLDFLLAQQHRPLEVAVEHRLVHLVDDPVQLLLRLVAFTHGGAAPQLHPGAGLVQQIDGLVGQEAVGDVAVGQVDRRVQHGRAVFDPVEQLIAALDAVQDPQGLRLVRRVDVHRLEPPHQAAVLVDVLGELLVRGGPDALHFAPGQGRLEDIGRVQAALRGAGADDAVDLVDEQDHAGILGGLGDDRLQPLLELAAVLGPGHHQAQVQRVDPLVLQARRHHALEDLLGQSFDDGGLAHAGLAQQDRVVLAAPAEDLDDAVHFKVAADEIVEDAALGQLRQVPGELGQQRMLLLLLGDLLFLGGLQQDLLGGDQVGAGFLQQPPGEALLLLQHPQQQMLGPHVLVVELGALLGGVLEDALDLLLHGDVDAGAAGRGLLVPGAQRRDQPLAQQVGLHAHAVQQLDRGLFRLPQQAQEQMSALDALGAELARLVASEEHDATGFFGKLFEHGSPPGKGPSPLALWGPG